MPTLAHYLIVSGLLFSLGLAGVLLRRNILIIFMGLELMLNAANLSLVAFSRFNLLPNGLPNYNAQVMVFFIITVAAAEVAVGLDRKSTRLNSSHEWISRMPSSA